MPETDPVAQAVPTEVRPHLLSRLHRYVGDCAAVAGRDVTLMRRDPVALVFLTVQPIIFVVLFDVVLGQALSLVLGVSYIQFLMPGVFAQTVCFGAMGTGVGVATDVSTGMVERFRTLPMAPSAMLVGRTIADLLRNAWVVLVMYVVGRALGFEVWGDAGQFLVGVGLLLLLGYSLSWVFALIGLSGRPERVFAISFPLLIPLVFLSSAFIPVALLPEWVQGFAAAQPVSQTVEVMRLAAFGGSDPAYAWNSLFFSAGITVTASALAAWRFRRAS
jgi:ABC-2 type transport system permease protein/oleandomycin transport system permease protein